MPGGENVARGEPLIKYDLQDSSRAVPLSPASSLPLRDPRLLPEDSQDREVAAGGLVIGARPHEDVAVPIEGDARDTGVREALEVDKALALLTELLVAASVRVVPGHAAMREHAKVGVARVGWDRLEGVAGLTTTIFSSPCKVMAKTRSLRSESVETLPPEPKLTSRWPSGRNRASLIPRVYLLPRVPSGFRLKLGMSHEKPAATILPSRWRATPQISSRPPKSTEAMPSRPKQSPGVVSVSDPSSRLPSGLSAPA